MNSIGEALNLWFRRDYETDAQACAARAVLLRTVLSLEEGPGFGPHVWKPFGIFDAHSACVATLDAALLPMAIEGETHSVGAIRSVATHPDWRGRGLFRTLMEAALAWIETQDARLSLLYSAEPDIYLNFGFREVPQHAFVGEAPSRSAPEPAHTLTLDNLDDRRLIAEMVSCRSSVSARCALQLDSEQYLANLAGDPGLEIMHLTDADALLVYEIVDQDLVIVDVVARDMPSIARLFGALNTRPRQVKTLFAPDLLGWHSRPVLDSTGLMIRGDLPRTMAKPFMLPPTAEF